MRKPKAEEPVAAQPADVLIVHDGHELWPLYPEDALYRAAQALTPDDAGIRHANGALALAVRGYTHEQAVARADAALVELAIPWDELRLTDLDVQQGNLLVMSERLARITYHIVQVNNKLTGLVSRHAAARELLEHAVNRGLGRSGEEAERRFTKDVRIALLISRVKQMRNMKIELIEGGAAIKALELTRDSLDLMWRTVSRCVSARMSEPLDRSD